MAGRAHSYSRMLLGHKLLRHHSRRTQKQQQTTYTPTNCKTNDPYNGQMPARRCVPSPKRPVFPSFSSLLPCPMLARFLKSRAENTLLLWKHSAGPMGGRRKLDAAATP